MKGSFSIIYASWDAYLRGFWIGYLNHERALLGFDWYDGEGYNLHLLFIKINFR